jgi:hypothetical protein
MEPVDEFGDHPHRLLRALGRGDGSIASRRLKRSPELQPLSRDHHQTLYVALRLRRASEKDVCEAARAFLDFWGQHGQLHFRAEEEVLLPGFWRGGGDSRADSVTRVLADHVEIRARAESIGSKPTLRELHDLGELLNAHVRFEEDELFPLIEQTLDGGQLAALGRELDRAERSG